MTRRSTAAAQDEPRPLFVAEPPAQFRIRPPIVVDSSVICALLFDEPERAQAEAKLAGRDLWAPRLLDHEIVNVALKKARQGMPAQAIEYALADYGAAQIELVDTDLAAQFELARRHALTAYDAAYLWLAVASRSPLATFDRKLAQAASSQLGSLE